MDRKPSGTWAPSPPPRHEAWEEAKRGKDLSNPVLYDSSATYEVGQVISHPTFGIGIVMGVKHGGKMYVVFENKTRTLVTGRSKG